MEQAPGTTWAAGSDDRSRSVDDTLRALFELPSVDRRALQLIYAHGLTQAETAVALKLPEATIRRCVARAMHELAARVSGAGGRRRQSIPKI